MNTTPLFNIENFRVFFEFIVLFIVVILSFRNHKLLIDKVNSEARIMFGFKLLLILSILALVIAICHVTQENSHGLDIILGSIATLSGQFSQWAFGGNKETPKLQ